jgi:redox-regulated HSP33 family molecular chaperone
MCEKNNKMKDKKIKKLDREKFKIERVIELKFDEEIIKLLEKSNIQYKCYSIISIKK